MELKIDGGVAIIKSQTPVITDAQTALDLIMTIYYEHNLNKIAIYKEAIAENFFILSTGLAGEIAQKFVNYSFKVAIIGDFSRYTSRPLRDYIYECNLGGPLRFTDTERNALKILEN